jgi:4-amino-4-deoxy-L-arabinose transferase-like glycosyltransferase
MLGNALAPIIPWHSGARFASAIMLGGGLYAIASATRSLHGSDAGRIAPLLAIGTLGLLVPAREAQPDLVSFLAVAWLLAALAQWDKFPLRAVVGAALALATGFLGSGLGTLLPMMGILGAAFLHPRWRNHNRWGWLLVVVLAPVLGGLWPLAVMMYEPTHLLAWWAKELQSLGGGENLGVRRLEILAWAAWPILPLALWSLWHERYRLTHSRNFIAFAGLAITLIFFLRSRESAHAILPMLAMLTLVAAPAAGTLRRGAANAFDWFGAMTLTLFMGLIWLGGIAILTGEPARVAKNFTKAGPGFVPEWSWLSLGLAATATLAWLLLLAALPRSPWRAATRWSLGVIILWVLLATLWLPWIDHGKTYRGVSADFRAALGAKPGCIEGLGLDEGHRASLDYFDGIRTVGVSSRTSHCHYRLVQSHPNATKPQPGWTLILERARPGDRKESLRLYRREPAPAKV